MQAAIAQLGERQTEDLKVPGSIPGRGILLNIFFDETSKKHVFVRNADKNILIRQFQFKVLTPFNG